jgi:hypothetical protein
MKRYAAPRKAAGLRRAGWLRRTAAALLAAALSACGLADQFADHSLEYNAQAEIIKNQNVLVNVVRAAYRRPLQFTDLTSITAQLSVAGSAGISIPFWGRRAGGGTLMIADPAVSASNAPTYTVSVLNTKEFYQGILTPIPVSIVSHYVHVGFPRYLVLSLLIAEMEYGSGSARRLYYNLPPRRTDGEAFPEPLKDLIATGLSTEDIPTYRRLGEPFDKYPDPKDIVELDAKGIRVVDLGRSRYQLEKVAIASRFCFDPALAAPNVTVRVGMPLGRSDERMTAKMLCGAEQDPAKQGANTDNNQDKPPVFIRTRSTEGLIYYLGEIARRQLGLGAPEPGAWDPGVFTIKPGPGRPTAIAASYEGKDFHIDVDSTGADPSSQALELVTALLAQNNSAKDLPLPSVIPVSR